jgi:DNA-binding transcriptional LysR family regulator
MPRLMRAFAREWPRTEVVATEFATDAPLLEQLAEATLDLGFAHLADGAGPFASCELVRTPTVLVVPRDSELAGVPRPVTVADIARHPLILRRSCRVSALLEQHVRAARGTVDVVFRTESSETAQTLAGAGLGVAVLPRLAVDAGDARTALVDLDALLPPTSVRLAWHRERLLTAAAQSFGEQARTVCRGLEHGEAGTAPAVAAAVAA